MLNKNINSLDAKQIYFNNNYRDDSIWYCNTFIKNYLPLRVIEKKGIQTEEKAK